MTDRETIVDQAAALTMAWLGNPHTRVEADDVPAFLRTMAAALEALDAPPAQAEQISAPEYKPAVSIRKSLASPDFIISLIDGKPYKTLRRHLTGHGLTPATYRERYGLKDDYPMVAETYAAFRSDMATKIGLGRKRSKKLLDTVATAAETVVEPVKTAAKRTRKVMSIVTK
jgi:predicted transcriptional regulator